jgi:hypothetical protein
MKNIHLLQTDKPSRLYKIGNELGLTDNPNYNPFAKQQHIYITFNETPKLNDWFLDIIDNEIFRVTKEDMDSLTMELNGLPFNFKKIILTTDEDLIKDGVQSIDDEFLEWFVKNPSCEEVEIDTIETLTGSFDAKGIKSNYVNVYKIIIPKEEPKQETTLEDKLKLLVEEWRKRQEHYVDVAYENVDNAHTNRKFTYKAMATRDCWKELLKLIEDEK